MKGSFLSFSSCFLLLQLGLIFQATLAFGEEKVTSSVVVPQDRSGTDVGADAVRPLVTGTTNGAAVEEKGKIESAPAATREKRQYNYDDGPQGEDDNTYYGEEEEAAGGGQYDEVPTAVEATYEEAPYAVPTYEETDSYVPTPAEEEYLQPEDADEVVDVEDQEAGGDYYAQPQPDGYDDEYDGYGAPRGTDLVDSVTTTTVDTQPPTSTQTTIDQTSATVGTNPGTVPDSGTPATTTTTTTTTSTTITNGATDGTATSTTPDATTTAASGGSSSSGTTTTTTTTAAAADTTTPGTSVGGTNTNTPEATTGGTNTGTADTSSSSQLVASSAREMDAGGMAQAYNRQYNKGSYKSAVASSSYNKASNSYQQKQGSYQTSSYTEQAASYKPQPSYKSKYQPAASPVYAPSVPSAYSKPYPMNKYEQKKPEPAQVPYGPYQAPDDADDGDYAQPQYQVDEYPAEHEQVDTYEESPPSETYDDQYTSPVDNYEGTYTPAEDDEKQQYEDAYPATPTPYDNENGGYDDTIYEPPPASYEENPYQQQKYPVPAKKPYQQPANGYGDDYDDPCQKKKKYPGKEKYEVQKEKYAGKEQYAAPQEEVPPYNGAPVAYPPKKADVYKKNDGQQYSTTSYGKPGMQQKEAKKSPAANLAGRSFGYGALGGLGGYGGLGGLGFGGGAFGAGVAGSATTLIVDESGSRRSGRRRSGSRRSRSRGRKEDRQTIRDLQAQLAALQRREEKEREKRVAAETARDTAQTDRRRLQRELITERSTRREWTKYANCLSQTLSAFRSVVTAALNTPGDQDDGGYKKDGGYYQGTGRRTVTSITVAVTAALTANNGANCVQPAT